MGNGASRFLDVLLLVVSGSDGDLSPVLEDFGGDLCGHFFDFEFLKETLLAKIFCYYFTLRDLNYENLSGLSNEVKSKLISIRPKTLGQAIRIDGITPAAVIILLSHIKKLKLKASA